MLQQHVTNLKLENLNLQEEIRKHQQDLEKYCKENEQYGWHICLRIKNMKKQEIKSSNKVLEAVKCLFSEASINIPDDCFDHAHLVRQNWWHSDSMLYNISSPHSVLQKKDGIEKRSLPWLNESQLRSTDQNEEICKQSFQCRFRICWHQLTQNPLFK